METSIKTIHQKLSNTELDISNLIMFIGHCMEKLHQRTQEYIKLQEELYIKDGIEKANIYSNFEG